MWKIYCFWSSPTIATGIGYRDEILTRRLDYALGCIGLKLGVVVYFCMIYWMSWASPRIRCLLVTTILAPLRTPRINAEILVVWEIFRHVCTEFKMFFLDGTVRLSKVQRAHAGGLSHKSTYLRCSREGFQHIERDGVSQIFEHFVVFWFYCVIINTFCYIAHLSYRRYSNKRVPTKVDAACVTEIRK